MLNIMENFKFYFVKSDFGTIGMYVLSVISRTLHNFSDGSFQCIREC